MESKTFVFTIHEYVEKTFAVTAKDIDEARELLPPCPKHGYMKRLHHGVKCLKNEEFTDCITLEEITPVKKPRHYWQKMQVVDEWPSEMNIRVKDGKVIKNEVN